MVYTTDLLGAWQLSRWQVERMDRLDHPFGEDAVGTLLYTADGWMHASVAAADRRSPQERILRRSSDGEVAELARSFFSYGGRWWLSADEVVHAVTVALDPELVGVELRRRVDLADGQLTLSAEEVVDHETRHHRLHWCRASDVERTSKRVEVGT